MIYGHDKTIHRTGEVNVELDTNGNVVAVWFRCMSLPFTQSVADEQRAMEMKQMYEEHKFPNIVAIEVEDMDKAYLRKKELMQENGWEEISRGKFKKIK